jgi:hypothetical protein
MRAATLGRLQRSFATAQEFAPLRWYRAAAIKPRANSAVGVNNLITNRFSGSCLISQQRSTLRLWPLGQKLADLLKN